MAFGPRLAPTWSLVILSVTTSSPDSWSWTTVPIRTSSRIDNRLTMPTRLMRQRTCFSFSFWLALRSTRRPCAGISGSSALMAVKSAASARSIAVRPTASSRSRSTSYMNAASSRASEDSWPLIETSSLREIAAFIACVTRSSCSAEIPPSTRSSFDAPGIPPGALNSSASKSRSPSEIPGPTAASSETSNARPAMVCRLRRTTGPSPFCARIWKPPDSAALTPTTADAPPETSSRPSCGIVSTLASGLNAAARLTDALTCTCPWPETQARAPAGKSRICSRSAAVLGITNRSSSCLVASARVSAAVSRSKGR